MKNEAEFKTAFKKSIRSYGGYSISLAAPMLSGIPDLYVIMPGYLPVLLEAKWLGEVKGPFKRKIQYKPMQMLYLDSCCSIHPRSALGLIGFKYENRYYCTIKPREINNKDEYIQLRDTGLGLIGFFNEAEKKIFNVNWLFESAEIPKLEPMQKYVVDKIDIPIPPGGVFAPAEYTLQVISSVQ